MKPHCSHTVLRLDLIFSLPSPWNIITRCHSRCLDPTAHIKYINYCKIQNWRLRYEATLTSQDTNYNFCAYDRLLSHKVVQLPSSLGPKPPPPFRLELFFKKQTIFVVLHRPKRCWNVYTFLKSCVLFLKKKFCNSLHLTISTWKI